ncbi:MAG TPA: hypothetical protein VFJ58_07370 [Armatimonadota bacterium]|nr:hypothetical protein [Armatimonadota bacterium]
MGVSVHSRWSWRGMRVREKLIVAALLVIMIHSAAVIVLGHRVESELAALKKQGYPVSCANIAPPPVPAAENAAPIYAIIFKRLKTPGYKKIDSRLRNLLDPSKPPGSPAAWNRIRKALLPYRDIPAEVERAESMPSCRFPVDWAAGYDARLPDTAHLEETSRFLITEALLATRDHQTAQAFHLITLDLRLEKAIRYEPVLVSQFVRFAIVDEACRALQTIAQPGNVAVPAERKTAQAVARVDLSSSLLRALTAQRAAGLQIFQTVGSHWGGAREILEGGGDGVEQRLCLIWDGTYIGRPLLYADELAFLHAMGQMIDRISEPWRIQDQQLRYFGRDVPLCDVLTQLTVLPPYELAPKRDTAIARLAGSRIFLALLTYKARSGVYPATLAVLSPLLGGPVPDDPFSGTGFVYHRQGSGFILYSIGPNLTDDGGLNKVAGPFQNFNDPDDIVWSRP